MVFPHYLENLLSQSFLCNVLIGLGEDKTRFEFWLTTSKVKGHFGKNNVNMVFDY